MNNRFFAEKVRDMAPESVGAETAMPLGFTFSFPVLQAVFFFFLLFPLLFLGLSSFLAVVHAHTRRRAQPLLQASINEGTLVEWTN